MKFRTALPWAATILAAAAIGLSAVSLNETASIADSLPAAPQPFSNGVIPGVFPAADHAAAFAAKEPAADQSNFMFGSRAAALKANVVHDSAAWTPSDQAEADASVIAWNACLPDRTGHFAVRHRFQLWVHPLDCTQWWNGDLRGKRLERLFSNW